MALDPPFVADCPDGPEALLLDESGAIDRDTSTVVARVPTHDDLPLTRDQRAHVERHPRHVNGGLMIHMTGMIGFAHAYYVLGLRHADGWIGYGTHVHDGRFKKLGKIGPPMLLRCHAKSVPKIGTSIFAPYDLEFPQHARRVH